MNPTRAYVSAKVVLTLVGAGLGFLAADWLLLRSWLTDPINLIYITLLGGLVGYILSPPLARKWDSLWQKSVSRVSRIPPDAVLASGVGATVALVITVLLNSLLEQIPGFNWGLSLLLTLILVTASSWFFVVNRRLFANPGFASRFSREGTLTTAVTSQKVIDTSAIIDGRILDVVEANFVEGRLLVPRFVLSELQHITDSDDPLRRKRGRRGLEVLDGLVQGRTVQTEVVSDDFPDTKAVDEKLVKLCLARRADLVTTDYNLNRVAALQGIKVLNVNQLANAVKATFLPGERLSLHIVKEGREPGQGLAYLEDGTMIVVEEASHLIGNTVETVVTSNLQTNMGRMIFARLEGNGYGATTQSV